MITQYAAAVVAVRAEPDHGTEQVTQLLPGEPALVWESSGDWVQVFAPWQPSRKAAEGYPGWVRAEALAARIPASRGNNPRLEGPEGPFRLLGEARGYVGVPYVWGGLTMAGIDCSGLVHAAARRLGLTVPRDASDQAAALPRVALDEVRAGDLYVFARPGEPIHHIGIATGVATSSGERPMLHASYSPHQREVVEETIPPDRLAHLVGARRLTCTTG